MAREEKKKDTKQQRVNISKQFNYRLMREGLRLCASSHVVKNKRKQALRESTKRLADSITIDLNTAS